MYLCDPVAFPTPNAQNFALTKEKDRFVKKLKRIHAQHIALP